MQELISHGVNPNVGLKSLDGWPGEVPIHIAAKVIIPEAIAILLCAGAQPDSQTRDGQTAFDIFAQERLKHQNPDTQLQKRMDCCKKMFDTSQLCTELRRLSSQGKTVLPTDLIITSEPYIIMDHLYDTQR